MEGSGSVGRFSRGVRVETTARRDLVAWTCDWDVACPGVESAVGLKESRGNVR